MHPLLKHPLWNAEVQKEQAGLRSNVRQYCGCPLASWKMVHLTGLSDLRKWLSGTSPRKWSKKSTFHRVKVLDAEAETLHRSENSKGSKSRKNWLNSWHISDAFCSQTVENSHTHWYFLFYRAYSIFSLSLQNSPLLLLFLLLQSLLLLLS
jgi:hypothetical protein